MKYIIICIYLLLSTVMIAQSSMTNKTTITVDKSIDGKIIQEVFVIEGEGADEKLKELEKDKSVVSISVEKHVEMRSDDADSADLLKMKEEIDAEISDMEKVTGKKAERREENVEIEVIANDKKEIKKYKVKIIENGIEEVIEWNGEGEMPAKMKKVMDSQETQILVKDNETKEVQKFVMSGSSSNGNTMIATKEDIVIAERNNNKGQIGVVIGAADGGVEILSFAENSMAKMVGLEVGDLITAVNKKVVITINDLVDGLSVYEPGDVVAIRFMRGDQKLTKDVMLKSAN